MSSNLYQELQACLLEPEPRVSSWLQIPPRSSTLSQKSLQMCTESLGSETGSDVSDELSIISPALGRKKPAPRSALLSKKLDKGGCFPPPLTTSGFRMRPLREEGRLVIEAMSVAPWRSTFLVERREGRIRVGVMRDEEEEVEEEDEMEEETDIEDIEGNSEIFGGEMGSEKFAGPRRGARKEACLSTERLVSWPKPFLVAAT